MNELLKSFIENVVFTAILAGTVASLITHWLSRRQFIQERWWDRRADAYSRVIGSLVSFVYSLEQWIPLEADPTIRETFKEEEGEIRQKYKEARDGMRRAATEGDYIISEIAAGALSEFFKPSSEPPSTVLDIMLRERDSARDCLKIIRDEARRDLSVR